MEKEETVENIPHKRIEVDVKKLKTFENQFTYREITEINSGIRWYDFVLPVDYINCDTKVFASVAERKGACSTAEDARLLVYNVAPNDGLVSVMIYLGNTTGRNVQGQIDLLGFIWG